MERTRDCHENGARWALVWERRHLACWAAGILPATAYRTEIDRTTLVRSDAICILSEEMVPNEQQRELLDPIDEGLIGWDKICELGEVILGKAQARKRPDDLVFCASTGGMGIQMAVAGAVVLRNARAHGAGQEISYEWFSADERRWIKGRVRVRPLDVGIADHHHRHVALCHVGPPYSFGRDWDRQSWGICLRPGGAGIVAVAFSDQLRKEATSLSSMS